MANWDKFNNITASINDNFYSNLNLKSITNSDHKHF